MGLRELVERKCPRCRTVGLRAKIVEDAGIELDQCPQCAGLWFDGGELEELLGDLAADFEEMPVGVPIYTALCPICREPMIHGNYPDTYVRIDYCRNCGGIWLDRDEFQEIYTVRERKLEDPELGEIPAQRQVHALERLRIGLKNVIANLFDDLPLGD